MRILHKHRLRETFNQVHYGGLYNWQAVSDARNLAADGWRVPDAFDFDDLINAVGGYSAGGGTLKDTNTNYWKSPNTGATNEHGFNGRAGGARLSTDGSYSNKWEREFFWTSTTSNIYTGRAMILYYDKINISLSNVSRGSGHSVRLLKETTELSHGQTGAYVGNDGQIYPTVCIYGQEWLATNVAETKFRNGDDIPLVTDANAWVNLTTPGRCTYDNEQTNNFERKSIFARYFCPLPTYHEIESENRLRDTTAGISQAQATTVWKADGTSKILLEIPEKAYTAGIIAVTGNNTPVTLTYTYETDYSTPFGTKSGYLVTSSAQNLNNLKVYNPASHSPTDIEKISLNLDASQTWVDNQFVLESGAGTGTTDNMIVFDRLNNETYGYILDAVDGDTWTSDDSIPSINQVVGYGVSSNNHLPNNLIANHDFENGSMGWVVIGDSSISDGKARIYSPDGMFTYIGQGGKLVVGLSYIFKYEIVANDGTNYIATDSFAGVHLPSTIGVHSYSSVATATTFSIKRAATGTDITLGYAEAYQLITDGIQIPIKANTKLTVLNTQPDYTRPAGYHFEFTGRNCVKGDGTAKLTFVNLPAYDAITAKIDGEETAITLTANEYVMESGKYYTDIVFKNTGAVVDVFWLADLDNEKDLPTTLVCYGNYKNGATATVNLGSSLIIEKCDGISPNYIYGFATIDNDNVMYPRLVDGSGYAGLIENEPGFTEHLPVISDDCKSSFTYSEQKIRAKKNKTFVDRADFFLKSDETTQLPVFTAGQPNEILISEIAAAGGLNQVIISPAHNNIIDIKLR